MHRTVLVAAVLALLGEVSEIKADPAPAADPEIVVVAKLMERSKTPLPHCGVLHVAEAMRYQVIKVERGTLRDKSIWVAHGCPQMPRSMYSKDAGTLKAFHIGDVHRLRIVRNAPSGAGGPSIMNAQGIRTWWARRVDLR